MKKFLTPLLVVLVFCVSYSSHAQTVTLKASILSPIVSTGSFFAEYAFSPTMSAQLGYFNTGMKVKDTRINGYGITPEVRYFFSGHAPTGFYGAAYARFQDFTLTREDTQANGTLTSAGGGALIGYQFLVGKYVAVDAFLGPGFNGATVKGGGGEENFNLGTFGGFSPRAGLTVGIAF